MENWIRYCAVIIFVSGLSLFGGAQNQGSLISTTQGAPVYLHTGLYEVSVEVFIEENSDFDNIYLYLSEPFKSIKWSLENVEKGKWVSVKRELNLEHPLENSLLQLHIPQFGGEGDLYIDDLLFYVKGTAPLNILNERIALYPNPVNATLRFEYDSSFDLKILDLSGALIDQKEIDEQAKSINVSNYPPGVYVFLISNDELYLTKRIIIENGQ